MAYRLTDYADNAKAFVRTNALALAVGFGIGILIGLMVF